MWPERQRATASKVLQCARRRLRLSTTLSPRTSTRADFSGRSGAASFLDSRAGSFCSVLLHGVFIELQPESRFLTQRHPAIHGSWCILIQHFPRQPVIDVNFSPPAVGHRRMKVHIEMVSVAHRKIESLSHARRLHSHGKSTYRKDMDVQQIDGSLLYEFTQCRKILPLSCRDGYARLLAQLGQQARVVVHNGFFEPHQMVRLKPFTPP